MPQYYHPMQQQQGGYEQQAQQLVPVMYQDPTTGQMMQTMQPMQSQHQQPPFLMNRYGSVVCGAWCAECSGRDEKS